MKFCLKNLVFYLKLSDKSLHVRNAIYVIVYNVLIYTDANTEIQV